MTIADEIRLASSRNELHPLVRDNWASARGKCNCSHSTERGISFCHLDFGHEGPHVNRSDRWQAPWPPPELYHRQLDPVIETQYAVLRAIDTIEAALRGCPHIYQADDYCIVCGSRCLGGSWQPPHWRELLISAFGVPAALARLGNDTPSKESTT